MSNNRTNNNSKRYYGGCRGNKLSMHERRQRLQQLREWIASTRPLVSQLEQGEDYRKQPSVSPKAWKKQVIEKMNEFEEWKEHSYPNLIIDEGTELEMIESPYYKAYRKFLDDLIETMLEAQELLDLLEHLLLQNSPNRVH